MLNPDPECEEVICFYPDCLGTAKFVDMLREKGRDPEVRKEISRLQKGTERLDALKLRQFVWLQQMAADGVTKQGSRFALLHNDLGAREQHVVLDVVEMEVRVDDHVERRRLDAVASPRLRRDSDHACRRFLGSRRQARVAGCV